MSNVQQSDPQGVNQFLSQGFDIRRFVDYLGYNFLWACHKFYLSLFTRRNTSKARISGTILNGPRTLSLL